MRSLPTGSAPSLAPLRDRIHAQAEGVVRACERKSAEEAAITLAEARRDADAITERAVQAGEAAARSDAAQRSARRRRAAHELDLAGRESLRREIEDRVVARARMLRTYPAYPRLLASLRERAREMLGPDAAIEEHPDGGVVAASGTRRLDLTLPALARAALGSPSEEVSALWMP
ncbi:hypothetical protein QQX10_08105 [Demequina sp. SYSU T00039]|uniref:Uncharacterized protein n=1 Tax=Demequina lignilytica TaxID=3051663 RepID=A0AAW7M341_9MICO|nr:MULTISPECIES: hypothetical protein [unclassified Demequina]MDN4477520.1 hypothetical protein [Demequina sp. SYSU T00039-1]MDN4488129.1 hypothetical protein [Demequina sp. SYSU T00039]MDN4490570.1 hypothetical protein [Demequina sp. SYSU T00068]